MRFANFATLCLLSLILLAVPESAQAQASLSQLGRAAAITNIYNRPTVSPYLRLLQNSNGAPGIGGSNNAIYQTQVRPAVERRQQSRAQQQQIQQIQNQLNRVQQEYRRPTGGRMSTGHPTRFMSYLHYYPSLGRR